MSSRTKRSEEDRYDRDYDDRSRRRSSESSRRSRYRSYRSRNSRDDDRYYRRRRRYRDEDSSSSSDDDSSSSSSSDDSSDEERHRKKRREESSAAETEKLMAAVNAANGSAGGKVKDLLHRVKMLTKSQMTPENKPDRELYIGNIPQGITGPQLLEFLNRAMLHIGLNCFGGDPVLKVWVSADQFYAFAELRSMNETSNALLLNGLPCMDKILTVGRPNASAHNKSLPTVETLARFIKTNGAQKLIALGVAGAAIPGVTISTEHAPAVPASVTTSSGDVGAPLTTTATAPISRTSAAPMEETPKEEKESSAVSADTPDVVAARSTSSATTTANQGRPEEKKKNANELVVVNLPKALSSEQVKLFLEPFGALRRCEVQTDTGGTSRGFARFEYVDPSVNEKAIVGLAGLDVAGKRIEILRFAEATERGLVVYDGGAAESCDASNGTFPVLRLGNMVTDEDLASDEEYEDICLDVKEECSKTGQVSAIEIPRQGDGRGFIFVQFKTNEGALKTLEALSGKVFCGRTIVASLFDAGKFLRKEWGENA